MKRQLVTIPFSHYCEKARWALDRAGMGYDEQMHLPILHAVPAMRASGQRQVPVLVTPHGPIVDSTRIIMWIDSMLAEEMRLFPVEPELHEAVSRWEERFDDELGPHVRRWAYGELLPDRARSIELLSRHAPALELAALRVSFQIAAVMMRRGMNIHPEACARSLAKVRAVFSAVSAEVSDGRRYLTGERFTAADLAFAALSAPALLPPRYARWLGERDEMPPSMWPVIDELRDTPAGRFALRVYAEDR